MRGRSIYLILVLFFLAVFIALPFIKVPISTTAPGIVNDLNSNNPIISMVEGRVVKSNIQRNNQVFKKGDTLLVLNTDQLHEYASYQSRQFQDFNAQQADLNRLTAGKMTAMQTGVYQQQVAAYQEKMGQIQSEYDLAVRDYDRVKKLFEEGIYTQAEYDKNRYKVENLKRQLENTHSQQLATWQVEKRDLERTLRENRREINTTQRQIANHVITSPVDGRLVDFSGIQLNAFVTPGTQIGVISHEASLVIEAQVSPRDIGFIREKQPIKAQIETFNYNQWGLLTGEVFEIQKNLRFTENDKAPFFVVYCNMDAPYLQLKNGYKGHIEKGMTVNVRFYLLDRTLWQLLFDKVDNWLNPNLG